MNIRNYLLNAIWQTVELTQMMITGIVTATVDLIITANIK
jgi:hypothetical protein